MRLTRTAKVKLNVLPETIKPTIEAYTDAFNYVCEIGWQGGTPMEYLCITKATRKLGNTFLPNLPSLPE